ncbi:MAG: MASE3 domain-containing protein [Sideroxydans sp.]|nr:MASE3 domain-containing protein [Sideroxydans sp.]
MPSGNFTLKHATWLVLGLGIVFVVVWQAPALYAVQGLANYLPLHMFAETFSIVVSMMVFGVAWNAYSPERPSNTVILACALLAVGLIDFAHMLSFKGMPDFITPSGPEKAINLWLSARLIAALALLAAALRPWRLSRNERARYLLLAASLVVTATVIWLGLVYPQAWPRTFIAGQGLTPFKIGAEYAIIALLLVPAVLFYLQAKRGQTHDAAGLFAATAITILSELSFTLYSDVADIFNLLGHLYKVVAYIFIYRAVFMSSVHEPFERVAAEYAENKRIEELLNSSYRLLQSVVEHAPLRVFWKDSELRYLGCNTAFARDAGMSHPDELIGKDDFGMGWREQAELYRADDKRVMESGMPKLGFEEPQTTPDGRTIWLRTSKVPLLDAGGKVFGVLGVYDDITERKQAEMEHQANLHFFESMNRVNKTMQGADELEQMMRDVLGVVLEIFDCDRVWLFYPCDPDAPRFRVPMEITKPEYPGAGIMNVDVPMPAEMAQNLKEVLEADAPLTYIVGTERPVNKPSAEQFGVKSQMLVALHPKSGKPWAFGMHQCAYPRVWSQEDVRLFQEIGRRLTDGLTGLLSLRELQESETKYRRIVETTAEGIWSIGPDDMTTFVNARMADILGYSAGEMDGRPMTDFMFGEDAPDHLKKLANRRRGVSECYERRFRRKDGQPIWMLASATPVLDEKNVYQGSFAMFADITARKQMEESLRENGHFLDAIVEHVPNMLFVKDAKELKFVRFNKAGEQLLGYSRDDLIGKSDRDFFPQEQADFFIGKDREIIANGELLDIPEEPISTKLHGQRFLHTRKIPIYSEDGSPLYLLGISEDITERKQEEERLRRSEQGLSEAQRIAHLGNWELDLVSNVLTWSDEIYRIFEIDPKKFGASYDAFLNAIHPGDRERVNRAYTDSVANKTPYEIVHRLLMPDGRIKYVIENCETHYDAAGKPLRSVGTVHDITERKLAEDELLERERHSQSLLRLSRKLESSRSYAEVLNAARDEVGSVIGYRNLWAYLLTEDRQYARVLMAGGPMADAVMSDERVATLPVKGDRMMEEIAAAKEIIVVEDAQTDARVNREIVAKLGNRSIVNVPIIFFDRHLGSVGMGTFGDEGVRIPSASENKYLMALASHIAAALDRIHLLDEREKAEREVKQLNRDLEQRVEERTAQLEAANKELEAFSYSVSHDLRTPLRAIDGFSHILLDEYTGKLDAEGQRLLNVVRDNTHRMGQLIDDILKFSRSGRLEMKLVEIDMEQQAREVLAELLPGSDNAKLQFEIGHIPPANGDSAMMRQVFVNLLSNAIKFSHGKEHPAIEVGSQVEGNEVVYYVKDNGAGFNMQYADKLFGVFQRLHSVEEFEGTGIGLAIVKRIINRHGGRVWAEGKVNEGATFYFSLPAIH